MVTHPSVYHARHKVTLLVRQMKLALGQTAKTVSFYQHCLVVTTGNQITSLELNRFSADHANVLAYPMDCLSVPVSECNDGILWQTPPSLFQ